MGAAMRAVLVGACWIVGLVGVLVAVLTGMSLSGG